MRKLSITLIIIGVLIIAYPTFNKVYSQYEQNKYLRQFESSLLNYQDDGDAAKNYEALNSTFKNNGPEIQPSPAKTEKTNNKSENNNIKAIGILKIDKIKLNLPIFYGTGPEILKIGAGQIKGTTQIGSTGNVVLASHRSHTYGRLFNRLDELIIGDEITITVKGNIYKYKIMDKTIVDPSDTSVLNKNNKDKVLTLVTCHPMVNPTHRLIVRAVQL